VRGVKVTYAVHDKPTRAPTSLYFFETDRWIVKVLGHSEAAGEIPSSVLDGFVQALPWNTLGDTTALH
jgi:hypothetical protein